MPQGFASEILLAGANLTNASVVVGVPGGCIPCITTLPPGYRFIELNGFPQSVVLVGPRIRVLAQVLNGANLAGMALNGSTFSGTNLFGAQMQNVDLTNATFSRASLWAADLTGANLTGVTWNDTTCPDTTNSDANGNTCIGHL